MLGYMKVLTALGIVFASLFGYAGAYAQTSSAKQHMR